MPTELLVKHRIWNCIAALLLPCTMGTDAFAQGAKLAVIDTGGEIWAKDLPGNSVGPGVTLTGPGLFCGPDGKHVAAHTRARQQGNQ